MKPTALLAGLIAGAVMSSASVASAQVPHDQGYSYVYKIAITPDGKLAFNVPGNLQGTGCSTPYYVFTSTTLSDDKVKAWFELALASYVSRTGVWVWTNGCTGGPQNPSAGYPILDHLQLNLPDQ